MFLVKNGIFKFLVKNFSFQKNIKRNLIIQNYEIKKEDSPIWIAYGSDEFLGIFLSVNDKRLEYEGDTSEEAYCTFQSLF